jgi:hypothetical protein
MGLYKLCEHKGRNRDRCAHPWWGSFRGVRVSLTKWANREIGSKAEAGAVLDEMRMAMRAGTIDARSRRGEGRAHDVSRARGRACSATRSASPTASFTGCGSPSC